MAAQVFLSLCGDSIEEMNLVHLCFYDNVYF